MTLPLLISGYPYGMEFFSVQKERAVQKLSKNLNSLQTMNDFEYVLQNCISSISPNDTDYYHCTEDQFNKTGGKDFDCCARVVIFKCMRNLLTTECGVSAEYVRANDAAHFNFWNNLEISDLPRNCIGDREWSLRHCNLYDESATSTTTTTESSWSTTKGPIWTTVNSTWSRPNSTWSRPNSTWTTIRPSTTSTPTTEDSKLLQLLFGQFQDYQVIVKVVKKNASSNANQEFLKYP